MDEMWSEADRIIVGAGSALPAIPATAGGVRALTGMPDLAMSMPLDELLKLDGEAFVAAAYHILLLRAPDPTGSQLLLDGLTAGESKILLLGWLWRSAEGRAAGQSLPGLGRRFAVQRAYRVPLVGPAVRACAMALRRAGVSRVIASRGEATVTAAQVRTYVSTSTAAANASIQALGVQVAELQSALDDAHRERVDTERALAGHLGTAWRSSAPRATMPALAAQVAAMGLLVAPDALTRRIEALVAQWRQWSEQSDGAQGASTSHALETLMREPALSQLAAALGVPAPPPVPDPSLDTLYVAFEDVFRGTRADIKQRQRFYLPMLAAAGAGSVERPILDIGCGRGEFIELLRDEALVGRGIDSNRAMAAQCRAMDLDVVGGDAVAYMAQREAGTLGAVTGFHIIEHLPFPLLVRLFDETLRALAPGGLMIFETPNPANIIVASHTFWYDPTHNKPLPSEMVAMIARHRGFDPVRIEALHPREGRLPGMTGTLPPALDILVNGPQDYAVIATRP